VWRHRKDENEFEGVLAAEIVVKLTHHIAFGKLDEKEVAQRLISLKWMSFMLA
jgi:hypothetical protein